MIELVLAIDVPKEIKHTALLGRRPYLTDIVGKLAFEITALHGHTPKARNGVDLPLGLTAIQAAKATGAKSQRERDYIDALAAMYVDYDKIPHGARVQSYLKAMEALAAKYPDDDEAQIFYAITLNVAASPTDKTYANQLKGAAILEAIN